ncbi:unnamed protein product [Hydatigera taeniaeformis]|uniref:Gelsolin-like domain-containing protein n=1 Tax=Hydatigena taeniaeformis TaxID=6205 RepID=A0A0R3XBQ1_HYDTA|nr:unnamed protein product [Hydatigera taeniaeformis]
MQKFNLEPVPNDEVGNFYNGDSYVICKATRSPGGDKLLYNVHFWIGKHSTADEYGTAAYKTVELDTFLDDAAIQHREVEGYESPLFKSYFDKLVILKGGYASGFRHVKPEEYRPRLLRFCKEGKTTYMRQVSFSKQSVHSGDVFILDLGDRAYQFNGSQCSAFEKSSAAAFLQDLESKRNGRCKTSVLDEAHTPQDVSCSTTGDSFNFFLSPHSTNSGLCYLMCRSKSPNLLRRLSSLFTSGSNFFRHDDGSRVSDASGKMELTIVSEGSASKHDIKPDDVYMILTKEGLFVYIGKGCSVLEKRNALSNAHKFLQTCPNPFLPITVVTDEQAESFLRGIWDE